jgi:hypothetical protein
MALLALLLSACGPPPCGSDCDPEIDAAYDEYMQGEIELEGEIYRSEQALEAYLDRYKDYDEYGGP